MSKLMLEKEFPLLDIKERTGWTDYIDFIHEKELTSPIMRGVDVFRRKFITVMVKIEGQIYSQAFFQRYTDGLGWMGARIGREIFSTCGGMKKFHYNFIDNLITKGEAVLPTKCVYGKDLILLDTKLYGKKAFLYDEKKEKAAKVIQAQWNKCRWDPSYKMCEIVQWNNIKELEKKFNLNLIN